MKTLQISEKLVVQLLELVGEMPVKIASNTYQLLNSEILPQIDEKCEILKVNNKKKTQVQEEPKATPKKDAK